MIHKICFKLVISLTNYVRKDKELDLLDTTTESLENFNS